MSGLRQLSAENRAVLSLVVARRLPVDRVGQMLRIRETAVRDRTRSAATQLAPAPAQVSAADRDEIIDFLVEAGARDANRSQPRVLQQSEAARNWARSLADELAALSEAPGAALDEALAAGARPRVRNLRFWASGATALAVIVVAILVLVLVLTGAFSNSKQNLATSAPHVVRRFALRGGNADTAAGGDAAVIRQARVLYLRITASGLPANHNDFYGLWLYNAPGDFQLIGIAWPPVSESGQLRVDVALPGNAVRFGALLVTREPSPQPRAPGTVMLHGSFALS